MNIQDPTFEDADSNSEKAVSTNEKNQINNDMPNTNISSKSLQNIQCSDVGLWSHLSKTDVDYWIKKGPLDCQHRNGPFDKSKREFTNASRYCSKNIFHGTKINGEKYDRDWLVYSPATGCVYCFVCKIFSASSTSLANEGFSDWRNLISIQQHENSEDHRNALFSFLTRRRESNLDLQLDMQVTQEKEYWKQVLRRVIDVISTLAERGLAFRGSEEKFGSSNNGNYLGILELISRYDPFLATHIGQYGNSGSGKSSYLSKTICDELIHLMALKIRESILQDIKTAGYFSISVDSTPDLSHIDQLAVIIRYVSPDNGLPIERFLTYLDIKSHTGENLAKVVLTYLKDECQINFSNCRGQSYDNAANMSGVYKGMQAKIREENEYAIYIPCAGHSLNLVGRSAVDSCLEAVRFFSTIQGLYVFFSASPKRWSILNEYSQQNKSFLQLKRLSDTRWNAHAQATSAVARGYNEIIAALYHIAEDGNESGEYRNEASALINIMEELEFVFMLEFWEKILNEFDKTSKALQNAEITISTTAKLYFALSQYVQNVQQDFDDIESQAKGKLPDIDYKSARKRKIKRRKQVNDGNAPDAAENLSPRDKFKMQSFIPMIDALKRNLEERALIYKNVSNMFSFLTNLDASEKEIQKDLLFLKQEFPKDVQHDFSSEIKHFHMYAKQVYQEKKYLSHEQLYQLIFQDKIQTAYPNVEAILRLFLSLMATNCSGERSFSKLKRIKSYLRTTMTQERLVDLTLMSIENDKLRAISFNEIIEQFAAIKSRKQNFK